MEDISQTHLKNSRSPIFDDNCITQRKRPITDPVKFVQKVRKLKNSSD